ncbi:MAG: CopG family transcriptional regulator [Spirochaetales bacterium]|nr:CopG family transcriptional regulator [Spirochaetales bacterium]
MKKANNKPTPEEIANMANDGKDISKYFTNKGTMKQPIRRVNVDFTEEMLHELDQIASELNVSRQAVIKMYLQQALDQHYLATNKVS